MEHSALAPAPLARRSSSPGARANSRAPWQSLTAADLSHNGMVRLPAAFGECAALTSLNLSSNRLPDLPPTLGALPALHELRLDSNCLRALPLALGRAPALTAMPLGENPALARPPPPVVQQGTKAVLAWLRAAEEAERAAAEQRGAAQRGGAEQQGEGDGDGEKGARPAWERAVQLAVQAAAEKAAMASAAHNGAHGKGAAALSFAERSRLEVEEMLRRSKVCRMRLCLVLCPCVRREATQPGSPAVLAPSSTCRCAAAACCLFVSPALSCWRVPLIAAQPNSWELVGSG